MLIFCGLASLPALTSADDWQTFKTVKLWIADVEYALEVAETGEQRQQGLMYRDHLPEFTGMLFLYSDLADHRIWMKNTRIPLTVIWLDATGVVIEIKQLQPCVSLICPSYGASLPSKYVIELNAGFNGLSQGDKIKLESLAD